MLGKIMQSAFAYLIPKFRLVEVAGLVMLLIAAVSTYFLIEKYEGKLPDHVAAELKTRSPTLMIKGPITKETLSDLEAIGYPISQEIRD